VTPFIWVGRAAQVSASKISVRLGDQATSLRVGIVQTSTSSTPEARSWFAKVANALTGKLISTRMSARIRRSVLGPVCGDSGFAVFCRPAPYSLLPASFAYGLEAHRPVVEGVALELAESVDAEHAINIVERAGAERLREHADVMQFNS